jgi:hypothetical protein
MHAIGLLHKKLEKSVCKIHKNRLRALLQMSEGLIYGRQLTLTGIGRSIRNRAMVKHKIKRVDRVLGNKKLYEERFGIYKALAKQIIGVIGRPIILIDWSQIGENDKYYLISAAVPYGGRSLPIYEETHPKKAYNTTPTNTGFLTNLKRIIPEGCNPIIVTDAGTAFRCPWFRKVKELGWDFVGRVRGGEKFCIKNQGRWFICKELYAKAKTQAMYLGMGVLTKRSKFTCNLILAKRPPKGRHSKTKHRSLKYESNDRKHSRRAKDPWLLATSLAPELFTANNIVAIYKQRMQIEELFRDIKNQRIGFGLIKTLTRNIDRLNILLLIGTIATYAVFLLGKAAQNLSLHYQFQVNTIKYRSVLSIFNLGCQICLCRRTKIPIMTLRKTLNSMSMFMLHVGNVS